ncbi:transposase domain-containing protein [Noviherbaspirillum malthae]
MKIVKLNGFDPVAYLRQVLECIADYTAHRIHDRLP